MDGGMDGSVDAGPTPCDATADCAAAMLADLVCDPQEKVCVPKCGTDSDCDYVAAGRCEKLDGTCRKTCTLEDYCPALDAGLVCDDPKGTCIAKCVQDDDCTALGKLGTRCNDASGK
jgi:hypothetical protein